jgi:undecaprenyl diphosphate synthase
MVVGGTADEWAGMSHDDWIKRLDELGSYCASVSVPWLTLRPYGPDDVPESVAATSHDVAGCRVLIDPSGDGRRRFAEAMRSLDPGTKVTETGVAAALYAPADSEPDLLVILGPATQLPQSLVWELAYAELVFVASEWSEFGATELAAAVVDFAGRRRRFGGLDSE